MSLTLSQYLRCSAPARICRGGRTHVGGEGFISMLSSFRQPSYGNRLQQYGSIHARPVQIRLAPLQGVHRRIWCGPIPSTALSGMVHTRHGLDKLGLPYPVVAMSAFIFWMLRRVDPVTRKSLQPPTVDKYVYHVRHYLLHSGVSITFLLQPILRSLRSGLIRQHRSTHSTRDSRRQAAPNQLVVVLRTQLLLLSHHLRT